MIDPTTCDERQAPPPARRRWRRLGDLVLDPATAAIAGASSATSSGPWKLMPWMGHKRIDETMLYVQFAEVHVRPVR